MKTLYVFSGHNGSGKSTLVERIADGLDVVNPDVCAGKNAVSIRRKKLAGNDDFGIETTLSGGMGFIEEAKAAGFTIKAYYIALSSPELSYERVQDRVAGGGHDVPKDAVFRRHERSLQNIRKLASLADELTVFDNSEGEYNKVFTLNGTKQTCELDESHFLYPYLPLM